MEIRVLFSGSSGNSLLIRSGETAVLVDAGLSGKQLIAALNEAETDPRELDSIIITHEHIDHIKGAGILSRRFNVPIYANELTWEHGQKLLGRISEDNKRVFTTGQGLDIGQLKIDTFTVSHDAADPVGFSFDDGECRFSMATDLGCPTEQVEKNLRNAQCILLEANHDEEILTMGNYPWSLKKRILGDAGHLSNDSAGELLVDLIGGKTEHVLLAHLSRENNMPQLAYLTVANLLMEAGIQPKKDLDLTVTYRERVSKPVVLGEK